ncbi:hypothetical protein ACOSQ4_027519 [Xanthoceras sorbifolium]
MGTESDSANYHHSSEQKRGENANQGTEFPNENVSNNHSVKKGPIVQNPNYEVGGSDNSSRPIFREIDPNSRSKRLVKKGSMVCDESSVLSTVLGMVVCVSSGDVSATIGGVCVSSDVSATVGGVYVSSYVTTSVGDVCASGDYSATVGGVCVISGDHRNVGASAVCSLYGVSADTAALLVFL